MYVPVKIGINTLTTVFLTVVWAVYLTIIEPHIYQMECVLEFININQLMLSISFFFCLASKKRPK